MLAWEWENEGGAEAACETAVAVLALVLSAGEVLLVEEVAGGGCRVDGGVDGGCPGGDASVGGGLRGRSKTRRETRGEALS